MTVVDPKDILCAIVMGDMHDFIEIMSRHVMRDTTRHHPSGRVPLGRQYLPSGDAGHDCAKAPHAMSCALQNHFM